MDLYLVLGTWALVIATLWIAWQQSSALRTDLKVRLQLRFSERFDSPATTSARERLAEQLLQSAEHDEIAESVMNFFEDMGLFLRRKHLDEELLWNTFGFYVIRWWEACRPYILEERERHRDPTLFADFEILNDRMKKRDASAALHQPTPAEIRAFLEDESRL